MIANLARSAAWALTGRCWACGQRRPRHYGWCHKAVNSRGWV